MTDIVATGEIYLDQKGRKYQIVVQATYLGSGEEMVVFQQLFEPFSILALEAEEFAEEFRAQKEKRQGSLGASVSLEETKHEEQPNDKLMEFLDADTFEEKYKVLVSMQNQITDKLIDNMAVVLDIVIPEGDVIKRYEDLKYAVRTRQRFESFNRLR